jgi:predicted nucleic acid-binding protein
MRIVADSNLIIASVVKKHPFHARAMAALAQPLRSGELVLLHHGPEPLRATPAEAYQALWDTYGDCTDVSTSLPDVWQFLRERDQKTSGGAVYDAMIALAAIEAGARQLLTFNPNHFQPFAGQIEIVVPA